MLTGLRVLIVEDEFLIALAVEDHLTRVGCAVVTVAHSVHDAINKTDATEFDAAVLDVNLKDGRIYPVATKLRERGIPFIFLTAYLPEDIDKAFREVPIAPKPFIPVRLTLALTSALRARQR